MPRWTPLPRPRPLLTTTVLLTLTLAGAQVQEALALITGGTGNSPITDPGWPQGAAGIFNHAGRVAWWEGPPFGGGQWHAECRGDAKAFSAVLADFARLDAKIRRVIVHDGVGHSFWLNPNREPAKQDAAKIDWMLMVWQPANWERLRKMPRDLNPTDPNDADQGPPAQIDVYTGGNVRWSEVTVPKGIEVVDHRLEAHGFTPADGVVLEGMVVDLATKQPLAARVKLQRVEPQAQGGYEYPLAAEAIADEQGRWVLKKAPAGWHRVVIDAAGYVPRVVGYGQFDDQPRWHSYSGNLSPAAAVAGHISDDAGQPLADVQVRLADVVAGADGLGGRYESPQEYTTQTDAAGRFQFEHAPLGSARIWLHKAGYCRPGLGHTIKMPATDVVLGMLKSARIRVTVDFGAAVRPAGYIVHMAPEEGAAVGKWSGSGNIDAKNQITFENVPPGLYVLYGQPNPGSEKEKTPPLPTLLKGGETAEVKVSAR